MAPGFTVSPPDVEWCGLLRLGGYLEEKVGRVFFVSHIKFQVLLECEDRAVRGAEEAKSGVLGRGQNQEIYPWRSTEYGWA